MKMKDLLSEEEALKKQDEDCLVCLTHTIAYDNMSSKTVCPHCEKETDLTVQFSVVGEANYYDPEQKIRKLITGQCNNCGKYFSLVPEKIIYNANHDIFYTGGKDYLGEDDENEIFKKVKKDVEKNLKDYYDRTAKGENIPIRQVSLWIKRSLTGAIAEYLYEKGLKL